MKKKSNQKSDLNDYNKEIAERVGKRIRDLRKQHSMTLKELASFLDTDYTRMGLIERGKATLHVGAVARIAEIFMVSPLYFIDENYHVEKIFMDQSRDLHKTLQTIRDNFSKIKGTTNGTIVLEMLNNIGDIITHSTPATKHKDNE